MPRFVELCLFVSTSTDRKLFMKDHFNDPLVLLKQYFLNMKIFITTELIVFLFADTVYLSIIRRNHVMVCVLHIK